MNEAEGFFEPDPATKTLRFCLRRGPFRSAMIVKAVVKMALSVVPNEELCNFQQALAWIGTDNESVVMAATPFFHTFVNGASAGNRIVVAVLTRKRDDFVAPYCYMLLRYGNEMLQMAVPGPEKDGLLNGSKITLRPYPCTSDWESEGNRTMLLQFNSMDFIRDEEVVITASYGQERES